MALATEVKLVAFRSKSETFSGESEETQNNIDNHRKAAHHHALAAKFHLEAVQHIEKGNFYQAEESAFIAQGHYTLAGQYQCKTALLFSW